MVEDAQSGDDGLVRRALWALGMVGVVVSVVVGSTGAVAYALGLDLSGTDPLYPEADFVFDYVVVDENPEATDWGILTITHNCGESINRRELFLRGTGFNGSVGENPPHTDRSVAEYEGGRGGIWRGTVSPEEGETLETDEGAYVTPGDTVRVYVAADYEIAMSHEDLEASASATLDTHEGPAHDGEPLPNGADECPSGDSWW